MIMEPQHDSSSLASFQTNALDDLKGIRDDLSEVSVVSSGADESENEEIHFKKGHDLLDEELPQFGYLCHNKCYKFFRELFLVSTYPRIHRAAFRSRYGICLERSRQLASFPWMIHPYSVFRWTWDVVISIVLLYTLIRQPLVMAYLRSDLSLEEHCVIMSLGFLFLIDMILNFRTGIVSKHSDVILLDPSLVVRNYLTTWFVIDFVSSIPLDSIFYFVEISSSKTGSEGPEFMRWIRLVGLLKVFRITRVIRYVTRLIEAYVRNSMYVRIINLHIMITLALHWLSCMHYLVADLMNPPEMEKKKQDSWITRQDLWNKPLPIKYINSVIRALSNMACLGYGVETPIEPEDILCTIVSILIGATFFALFIGNLSSILINTDVAQKKYSEILNQVMEYMRFKQIPEELQNRVVMYYEQRYRRSFFNENEILANVSDVLRRELQVYNCRHLVDQVPLFKGVPQAVMQSLVGHLKFEVYLPRDVIVNAGTVGDAMYFIEHGAVSVITPTGKSIAFLKDGDFFGEVALLTHQHRNASVVALGYCDIYRLDKADFEVCVQGYPEVYQQMLKIAEARDQSLNVDAAKHRAEKTESKTSRRTEKK